MPSIIKTPISLILFLASFASAQSFSVNSGAGIIMTPTARMLEEGTVTLNISEYAPFNKVSLVANPFNWLEASVYYTDVNVRRYSPGSKQSYKDKGFSFKIKALEETTYSPALAIGFEDIAGTSIFKSEYFVASKKINNFELSLGLGFGDFGSRGNVENFIRDGERSKWDFTTGGEIKDDFFKGKSSFFGGVQYELKSFGTILKAEYDGNSYADNFDLLPNLARYLPRSRYNFGLEKSFKEKYSIGLNFIKGNEIAVNFTARFNTAKSKDDYDLRVRSISIADTRYIRILEDLKNVNIYLQNAFIDDRNKVVKIKYVQNSYYDNVTVANKIARYLEQHHDLYGYEINITPGNGAFELSTLSRKYDRHFDTRKSVNTDYPFSPKINYPVFDYALNPNLISHIGSPSGFYFGGIDLNLAGILEFKYFQISSTYNIRLYDNFERLNYDPNATKLPQVRTNIQEYLKKSKNSFDELTINFFNQVTSEHNFLFSAGHLEQMFSGTHFEYLYKPTNSLFSLGLEFSTVKQRDFNGSFDSFLDYQTNTYHLNTYLAEPKHRLIFHLSYGKYLAKDEGFTFDVSRRFKNGASMGVYFSLTNISKEDFGEGSFDKGIYFQYPLNIFNKNRNTNSFSSFHYKPITRDGAAKLNVPKRLQSLTQGSQYYEQFFNRNY